MLGLICIFVLTVFLSHAVRADEPGNLGDCLTARVESATGDVAATIGRHACQNQFPQIPSGCYVLQCEKNYFWIDEGLETIKVAADQTKEPIEAKVRAFLLSRESLQVAINVDGQGYHLKFDKGLGTLSSPDDTWIWFSLCHVV